MEHSASEDRDGCGENLAWSSDAASMETDQAVTMWYDEVSDPGYDFESPGYTSGVGHFTQVVWKESTKLGCGVSGGYVVCRYCETAGNWTMDGEFERNVLKGCYGGDLADCVNSGDDDADAGEGDDDAAAGESDDDDVADSNSDLSALELAALDETRDAISSIESGLANSNMDELELAAYNSCMSGVTLPNKGTDPVKHLIALSKCYNVSGKEGWGCTGNRRSCDAGMCCGVSYVTLTTPISYTCQDEASSMNGDYNFECIDGEKDDASKLVATAAAFLTASYMLA